MSDMSVLSMLCYLRKPRLNTVLSKFFANSEVSSKYKVSFRLGGESEEVGSR